MRRLLTYLMLAAVLTATGREPREVTVTATYDYIAGAKESAAQARMAAIERAQLDAIAREFGSAMSLSNISISDKRGDAERDEFHQFTASDVRGEWIETLGEPEVTVSTYKDELVYHVKIRGRIRELTGKRVDLDWAVLYNGTDPVRDRLRNGTFRVGDYMYVYFRSPVDGYLVAYLGDDDEAHTMQCLLPYRGVGDGAMRIEADRTYIFFSRDLADEAVAPHVARIKMNSRSDADVNRLYLVFSPNEFAKVADTNSSAPGAVAYDRRGNAIDLLPRQTDFARFQKWLARSRRHDPDMQVLRAAFSIEKR